MKCSQLKLGWLNTLTGETKTHDFALGLGPCGRWVTELTVEIDLATVRVVQTSYEVDHGALKARLDQKREELRAEQVRAIGSIKTGRGWGWDNLQYMTPTKESWDAHYKAYQAERWALGVFTPEVKHFVYRLEDIRGRITAL